MISRRIPVYGILSEPLRGTLKSLQGGAQFDEYVPAAHVKFLEQVGIKVVPISYKLSMQALTEKLN